MAQPQSAAARARDTHAGLGNRQSVLKLFLVTLAEYKHRLHGWDTPHVRVWQHVRITAAAHMPAPPWQQAQVSYTRR